MRLKWAALGVLAAGLAGSTAEAHVVCTVLADAASNSVLLQQGDCTNRVTPASTFKIAISLMGYDSGFLQDEHAPALPFRDGYASWRPSWRQTTDPTHWIAESVVWFSQQVTQSFGEARFQRYVDAFDYGNKDLSGNAGKHDGLTEAWLSASLRISPLEQVAFLRKLVDRQLPVTDHAIEMTSRITLAATLPGGWEVHGKTGTGAPPAPGGGLDEAHSYGWYVGWAVKGARKVVFARLMQDDEAMEEPAGLRTRAAFLDELPGLLASLPD
jgi:beta-lactamase class D